MYCIRYAFYTGLHSIGSADYEKKDFVSKSLQVDSSASQLRKRPLTLEHPAPLKQFKQSEDTKSILKMQLTDTELSIQSEMDASVQCLEQQEALKLKSIHIEFLELEYQLQHILQSYDTKAMFKKCKSLMASYTNNIPLFSSDQLQTFGECKQAPALIQALSPYFNWINHSVLREVIGACNNTAVINLLDQFDSHIDLSLPTTDYPIPQPSPNMIPYDTITMTVLAVELSTKLNTISLQQVIDIQNLLQEQFQLSSHVFQLLAVNSAPMLYWIIPKCVVSVITSNVAQKRNFLHQNNIMNLSIYPGLVYATCSTIKVGPLSFLNHYEGLEVCM